MATTAPTAPIAPIAPTALTALLARSTIPEPGVPVPTVLVEAVASAIGNAIVDSGNPTILSSATGLLSVLSPCPDGTFDQTTLAAYLATCRLKLRDVVPHMVTLGLVVVVGSGHTTAFALPGTIAVAATPLAPATLGDVKVGLASNDTQAPTPVSVISHGTRVPPIPPIVIDFITVHDTVKLSLIMLQPLIAEAVKRTGYKIGELMKADKRVVVSGSLGNVSVSMAGPIRETVPLPLKTVLDNLTIGEHGVLASRVGKLEEVKALTSHTCLKDLVGLIPQSYVLRIAIPNSPGSATIYKVAVPEA